MPWNYVRTLIPHPTNQNQLILNPAKQFIRPFDLTGKPPNHIIRIPANSQAGPIPFTAEDDGPIEIFFFKAAVFADTGGNPGTSTTTYDIEVVIEHFAKRQVLMNRAIPLKLIAGDGGRPYVLPETIFIPATQSLGVTFFNREATPRHVELVMSGIKFYPASTPEVIARDLLCYIDRRERTWPFWATTDQRISLTAGQQGAIHTCQLGMDSDLEVFKLSAISSAEFRQQIVDGQTGRSLSNATSLVHGSLLYGGVQPVAMQGIAGSGGVFPTRLATTYLARRGTQIIFVTSNLDAGADNEVRVVLGGRKISYTV